MSLCGTGSNCILYRWSNVRESECVCNVSKLLGQRRERQRDEGVC